jgi:hypothetical protein
VNGLSLRIKAEVLASPDADYVLARYLASNSPGIMDLITIPLTTNKETSTEFAIPVIILGTQRTIHIRISDT